MPHTLCWRLGIFLVRRLPREEPLLVFAFVFSALAYEVLNWLSPSVLLTKQDAMRSVFLLSFRSPIPI